VDKVIVKTSELFNETLSKKILSGNKKLADRIADFLKLKKENPMKPFGKDDNVFVGNNPVLKHAIPNETLVHAKLTSDISILYTITGRDPWVIKLYGIFTHDELGTGQPPNTKRMKQAAARMSNTTF
jgi:hypothetical protein